MKKVKICLFVSAFLAVFIVLPNLVSAATTAEIQAQINALMLQIKQLQEQLAQMQTQPVAWCHDFNVNLKIGDRSAEVDALHIALQKSGFSIDAHELAGHVADNGDFGELTASAVTGFQQKYKDEILTPWGLQYGTGFVGKTTRAKLNKLYGCGVIKLPCPMYSQPLCKEGEKIIFGGFDRNGCALPGKCVPVSIAPSITVLSPNGGETWTVGSTQTIRWTSQNLPSGSNYQFSIDLRINDVHIRSLFPSTENDGTQQWIVPDIVSSGIATGLKIRLSLYEVGTGKLLYYDDSDATFSIMAAGTPSITVLSPNRGETLVKGTSYTIQWTGGYSTITDPTRSVALMLVKEDGTTQVGWIQFGNQPSGSYSWDPAKVRSAIGYPYNVDVPVGKYKIRVIDYNDPKGRAVAYDVSDAAFSIVEPSITVLSPNGGERWEIGKTYQVTWKASGFSPNDYVKVLIRKGAWDSGNAVNYGNTLANTESYRNIAILNPAGGDTSFYEVGKNYFIDISLVTSSGGPLANDFSDAPFSIVAASSGVGQYYSTGQTANVLESMKIILDQIQEAINKLKN